jgi:anti-sigma B factor antagonist
MQITVDTLEDSTAVVALDGELTSATAPQAQEVILPLMQTHRQIVLDMRKMAYMSSAGLRVLLLIYRQITASQGRVALVGITDEIKDTMFITGFLSFFRIFDSLEAGIAAVRST